MIADSKPTGLVESAQALRNGARDVQRAGLLEVATQLRSIRQHRNAMIRQIAAWGDGPEVLVALAGFSPAQVTEILLNG